VIPDSRSPQRPTTIDDEGLADQKGRGIGSQEHEGTVKLVRLARPTHRCPMIDPSDLFEVRELAGHLGWKPAACDRINADSPRGPLGGQLACQTTDHPDLLNKVSDDDIRSWVEIVA
jgi:hypothetical protein